MYVRTCTGTCAVTICTCTYDFCKVQVKESKGRHECLTKNVEAMKMKLKNAIEQNAAEQQLLDKEVCIILYTCT